MRDQPAKIDLWSFSLDCDAELLSQAERILSEEEKERAKRFLVDLPRRRFVLRRSMRRVLLGHLTDLQASEIRFEKPDRSKPRLSGVETTIDFNCSHSGNRGIIVTGTCPLGVDIEALDRPIDHLRFAQRCFTEVEFRDIQLYRGSARRVTFFNCWTGKEAYLKAIGLGLTKKLNSFAVRCAPDEPPGLRWDIEAQLSPDTCSFFRFTKDEFVATVVLDSAAGATKLAFHELDLLSIRTGEPMEMQSRSVWRES